MTKEEEVQCKKIELLETIICDFMIEQHVVTNEEDEAIATNKLIEVLEENASKKVWKILNSDKKVSKQLINLMYSIYDAGAVQGMNYVVQNNISCESLNCEELI